MKYKKCKKCYNPLMNKWLDSTIQAYLDYFGQTTRPVVWDVGSRDGDDGVELARRIYPGHPDRFWKRATVVCVEPNPPQAQLIRQTYPEVKVLPLAVSDYRGTSEFVRVVSESKGAVGMSSLDVAHQDTKGTDPKEVITVRVERLDRLVRPDALIDVMKVDCEGYSWEVLHGAGKRLQNIKVLHVETEHPEFSAWSHEGHKNNEQVAAFMESQGFMLYATEYEYGGIQDQVWVNASLAEPRSA